VGATSVSNGGEINASEKIGGAVNNSFKPLLDEFKRWRVLLDEPYGARKDRYRDSVVDRR
jgi:hypothetical protein